MGLYDRDYIKEQSNEAYYGDEVIQRTQSELSTFIKDTYQLFAASLLAGAAGTYAGVGIAGIIAANYWWFAIPWLLFGIFGLNALKNISGVNYIALFGFTFVGGMIIGPLVSSVLALSNGTQLVAGAFITTSVIVGALSIYAMKTETDFSSWGKPLMIAFIIVLIASLVNLFFFKSPMIQVVISGIFVMIFSALVLYDTQNIIQGAYEHPIDGAIALYLDFLNIFTSLLQIFGILGGDD